MPRSLHLALAISCSLLPFSATAQQPSFTVGTAAAKPGQKATGTIDVPAGSDAATQIPVVVIRGANPGPTLALVSGAHGTEYVSIIALQALITLFPSAKLARTISAILIG